MKTFILLTVTLLYLNTLVAQSTVNKINNSTNKLDSTNNSVNHASNTISNTSDAVKGLAQTIGSVLKSKHKKNKENETPAVIPANTITISIAGINYSKLEVMQDSIEAVKGVQSADISYKAGSSTIQVLYSGKGGQLWKALSPGLKAMFNVISIDDNTIAVDIIK